MPEPTGDKPPQEPVDTARRHAARAHHGDVLDAVTEATAAVIGRPVDDGGKSFFELGATSLDLGRIRSRLEAALGIEIDVAAFFAAPTPDGLAAHLAAEVPALTPTGKATATAPDAAPSADAPKKDCAEGIAIVAMAGRFPGAADLDRLWEAICNGESFVAPLDPETLEDAIPPERRARADYVPVRPVLDGVEDFDAEFFGMRRREAALMDPQARVFLEIAWEALERAGHSPDEHDLSVGIYAGSAPPTYLLNNVLATRADAARVAREYQAGSFAEMIGNMNDTLATRVAYKLDLRGPAVTVQTACSTSLSAVATACSSLAAGECDMALAGGVSITFPQRRGYFCVEGGMVAAKGECRPFDADASGTVFSHAAGVVVLRRLADALADGDRIIAVIRGWAMNNDGKEKLSFTAPSIDGQRRVIRKALRRAGVTAAEIGYVECHGTATPLGDPVEVAALRSAFGKDADAGGAPCYLGSIKGNIGHADAAAGIMGLMKAALVVQTGTVPPVAGFSRLNPAIDIEGTRFFVPQAAVPWPATDRPRLAGVTSLGVGGTNVHVILSEPPAQEEKAADAARTDGAVVLPLSARTPAALRATAARLADHLEATDAPLRDVAFTLQRGRRAFPWRGVAVGRTRAELAAALRALPRPVAPAAPTAPALVLAFPGQGQQFPGMGAGLYHAEPDFARVIDEGAERLEPLLGRDIRTLLLARTDDAEAARLLARTEFTQPALFLVELGLYRLLEARGVRPDALLGHSVGEFAAAVASGIMDEDNATRVIAARGRLMQAAPPGAMLSVRAGVRALGPILDAFPEVEIAAENAPGLTVVAGPEAAVEALGERLSAEGVRTVRIRTSHAFHTAAMATAAEALERELETVPLSPPEIPIFSTLTGARLGPEEATDPGYWARQCREAVRFAAAAASTVADLPGPPVFVECGPGQALSTFLAQSVPADARTAIIDTLPGHDRKDEAEDEEALATAVGRLWASGVRIDWRKVGPQGRRVPLPTYPFERVRCWVEAPELAAVAGGDAAADAAAGGTAHPGRAAVPEAPRPAVVAGSAEGETRADRIRQAVLSIIETESGEGIDAEARATPFLDLGFDSLLLGQIATRIASELDVTLSFRELVTRHSSVEALVAHLDAVLPPERLADMPPAAAGGTPPPANAATDTPRSDRLDEAGGTPGHAAGAGAEWLIAEQLRTMERVFAAQLAALRSSPEAPDPTPPSPPGPNRTRSEDGGAETLANTTAPPAPAGNGMNGVIPLTEAQREIWLADQLGPHASIAFNQTFAVHLKGAIDPAALERAIDHVAQRHDALRARFAADGQGFRVAPPAPVGLTVTTAEGAAEAEAALAPILEAEARTPFDLVTGPLLRAHLVREGTERATLVLSSHHIVCDGAASMTVVAEVLEAAAAFAAGRTPALPPAASFADWARAEAKASRSRDLAYWERVLEAPPPLPDLPLDRARPARRTFAGGTRRRRLPAALADHLKAAARRHQTTMFALLAAGAGLLVSRLSGARDLVLGVPAGATDRTGDSPIVGHRVNLLPLRLRIDEARTVADFLHTVRDDVLGALDHRNTTLGEILRHMDMSRTVDRLPLTEVQFNYQPGRPLPPIPGLEAGVELNAKAASNFDIFLNALGDADGVEIWADFNAEVLDPETVDRWLGHFETLLDGLADVDPAEPLGTVPTLGRDEERDLAERWNDTAVPEAPPLTLDRLVLEEAARSPDRIAVEAGDETLDYRTLVGRAAALQSALTDRIGRTPGPVGVAMSRSVDLPVALLGVLMTGRCYVPMDPAHPPARLEAILKAAGARHVICDDPGLSSRLSAAGAEVIAPGMAGARPPSESLATPTRRPM